MDDLRIPRKGFENQTPRPVFREFIQQGEKHESINLLDRCCCHRMGCDRNYARPVEPGHQYCRRSCGRLPGWLLPQPHLRGRNN